MNLTKRRRLAAAKRSRDEGSSDAPRQRRSRRPSSRKAQDQDRTTKALRPWFRVWFTESGGTRGRGDCSVVGRRSGSELGTRTGPARAAGPLPVPTPRRCAWALAILPDFSVKNHLSGKNKTFSGFFSGKKIRLAHWVLAAQGKQGRARPAWFLRAGAGQRPSNRFAHPGRQGRPWSGQRGIGPRAVGRTPPAAGRRRRMSVRSAGAGRTPPPRGGGWLGLRRCGTPQPQRPGEARLAAAAALSGPTLPCRPAPIDKRPPQKAMQSEGSEDCWVMAGVTRARTRPSCRKGGGWGPSRPFRGPQAGDGGHFGAPRRGIGAVRRSPSGNVRSPQAENRPPKLRDGCLTGPHPDGAGARVPRSLAAAPGGQGRAEDDAPGCRQTLQRVAGAATKVKSLQRALRCGCWGR